MRDMLGRPYVKAKGIEIEDGMVDRAMRGTRNPLPEGECDLIGCYRHNPSTMIHLLVEEIRKRMSER
ncbi:MAG: hypothetical protein ACI4Q9_04400 [Candidatus Methanomethylophilaceae archaeon]